MSIRAITRVTGVHKVTVAKLMNDAGRALRAYQDADFVNLNAKRVQIDEIWSFTYAKQKNVPTAKAAPEGAGDTWTWTGIDADSKLVMSWMVGGRDGGYAMAFIDDLARLWKMADLVAIEEAAEAPPAKKRGRYKEKVPA